MWRSILRVKWIVLIGLIGLGALAVVTTTWFAQGRGYPAKPVTVVVPFPAGGPSDVVARIVTDQMGKILGQTLVIENVGGAGGTIGSARVAAADPDGYTLLAGSMGSHVSAPLLTPNVKYDSERDFEPIGFTAHSPAVIVARKDFPSKDLLEFVDYVKKNGEHVKQAHGGIGASSHMACLLFALQTGIRPALVAYRGTGPALNDLIGGHVDFFCEQVVSVAPQIAAGTIRAYAISSSERLPTLADVPTAKELGVNYQMSIWAGIFAPKGTPKGIIEKLAAALDRSLDEPGVKAKLADLGGSIPSKDERTPAKFNSFVKAEIARWSPILKAASADSSQIIAPKTHGTEATRLAEEIQKLERERLIVHRERILWEEAEESRREQAARERLESENKERVEQDKLQRAERERLEQIESKNLEHARKERESREQADAEQPNRRESEAAAREAREKASREQPEHERVASENRDAKEQETEPDKAAEQPAPSVSDNRIATLPAPVEQTPADPELKGGALVRAIKQELKRVGCYDGRLDEDWHTPPARASIQKFARLARLAMSPAEPTNELLDAIRARSERICPLECGRRQIERDGRCIAKKCPSGFELDDDGDCTPRRRTATRHETDEDGDRPRIRSHEPKRRASADSEWDPHDKKRIVTPGGRDTCGPNGCQKVPIGCRAVRQPDGRNGTGRKIICP